jgi:hypothetical protein
MSAPASDRFALAVGAACAAAIACAVVVVPAFAQAPAPSGASAKAAAAKDAPAQPPLSKDGRYGLQVLAAAVDVYAAPEPASQVIAQEQQGAQLHAVERKGPWFRIELVDGRPGWVRYVAGKARPNFSVDSAPGLARALPGTAPAPAEAVAAPAAPKPAESLPDDRIVQLRPMGRPLEPLIPEIDPAQVPPPAPLLPRETVPVPDRWRLVDELGVVHQRWFDPYHPNALKGDRPVWGDDWFVNVGAISDTVYEARRVPTAVGAQSTLDPGSNDQFGRGRQSQFVENLILSFALIKGDTTFRPPDFELRVVPVVNFNRTDVGEVRVTNVDPRTGTTRNDSIVALQEAFVDVHLRNVSDNYDFDSIRVGIQPFISDFRGLLYVDEPIGVRLFGNRDSNRWQYNLAWFRRIEKDTNSGLNDIGKPLRDEDIFVANLYRQDFPVPGFTLQGTVIYDDNRENSEAYYDNNGFLTRPAALGDERLHTYKVTYLGVNGDGHFGRWNLTGSGYYVFGSVNHDPLAQQKVDVSAFYAVGEVSRDFDWIRVRGTGLFQSGDKDPFDNKANGFDAILENPQIAGAETSYWIRQAVPLIGGGGVALSGRNGVLAALRSSKDEGQANFTNPGLALVGLGADFDIAPSFRGIVNVNQLWFANTSSLAVLRQQGAVSREIGTDASVAVQYRPLFSQNVVINASAAVLFPGQGLKDLYSLDGNKTQYSILVNLLLTF